MSNAASIPVQFDFSLQGSPTLILMLAMTESNGENLSKLLDTLPVEQRPAFFVRLKAESDELRERVAQATNRLRTWLETTTSTETLSAAAQVSKTSAEE